MDNEEKKYTKQEVIDAVRAEITETNKQLGIAKGFRDKDYLYLGIVHAALDRLDRTQPTQ